MAAVIVQFSPAGEYMALRLRDCQSRTAKHERGNITGFSVRSRSRLMAKIAQIKKHHLPLFVTLTYPAEFPTDYKEYKYHVHKFFISLFYRFPAAGVVWKLEFQERGAAHFHLLLFGVSLDDAREYIPGIWYKVAGSSDPNHLLFHQGQLNNEHCVNAIRSWHGVKAYASKYFTKLDDTQERSGRFWGVRGLVPFSPLLELKIDMKTALQFRRALRRAIGFRSKRFGFWCWNYKVDWLHFVTRIEDEYQAELFVLNTIPPPDERHEDINFF